MDRIPQHLAVLAAGITEDDVATQREQLSSVARYLHALGVALQMYEHANRSAATLIEAAQVLEWHKELMDPAVIRSLAVSDARRGMAVVDAKRAAEAQHDPRFPRAYWRLLQVIAEGACLGVRTEAARRVLLRVIRLAERKARTPTKKRSAKRRGLVIVGAADNVPTSE